MAYFLPLPRVLSRPNILMGGERNLVLVNIMLASSIGVPSGSFTTMGLCAVAWFAAHRGLVWMAEIDPQLSQVYLRSLKYRRFYPARGRVGKQRTSRAILIFVAAFGLLLVWVVLRAFW